MFRKEPEKLNQQATTVRQRLTELGLTVVDIAADGRLVTHPSDCAASPQHLEQLSSTAQRETLLNRKLEAVELSPTLFAMALPDPLAVDAYPVALIVGCNLDDTRQRARSIQTLVGWWIDDTTKIDNALETAAQSSHELALAYEELSLIDHLTKRSNHTLSTEARLDEAINELCEVARLRFLGLHLAEDRPRLANLRGKTFFNTHATQDISSIRAAGEWLLDQLRDTPGVTRFTPHPYEGLAAIGQEIVALRVQHKAQTLGVLYGADRFDDERLDATDLARFESLGASISVFLNNTLLFSEMHGLFAGTLNALSTAIDAKDAYTHGHSQRVANLTFRLARAAGCSEQTTENLYRSALIHDLGKIGVPESILNKEGKLTSDEYDAVKKHPQIGARILRDIEAMTDLIPGVLSHHERWAGGGYPQGIRGNAIPIEGRIIALADSYDAMHSRRSYRDAMSHQTVMDIIRDASGEQFDPELTQIFLQIDFDNLDQPHATRRAA